MMLCSSMAVVRGRIYSLTLDWFSVLAFTTHDSRIRSKAPFRSLSRSARSIPITVSLGIGH